MDISILYIFLYIDLIVIEANIKYRFFSTATFTQNIAYYTYCFASLGFSINISQKSFILVESILFIIFNSYILFCYINIINRKCCLLFSTLQSLSHVSNWEMGKTISFSIKLVYFFNPCINITFSYSNFKTNLGT